MFSVPQRIIQVRSIPAAKPPCGGVPNSSGKTHVIEFHPQGTSESLKIRLYFDSETFQHVRSEYREEYTGKEATFGQLGQVNGYVMQLIETYKDYKTYDNITLPSNYTVKYMGSSSKGTWEYDWSFKLNEVKFNQPLKDGFFTF